MNKKSNKFEDIFSIICLLFFVLLVIGFMSISVNSIYVNSKLGSIFDNIDLKSLKCKDCNSSLIYFNDDFNKDIYEYCPDCGKSLYKVGCLNYLHSRYCDNCDIYYGEDNTYCGVCGKELKVFDLDEDIYISSLLEDYENYKNVISYIRKKIRN